MSDMDDALAGVIAFITRDPRLCPNRQQEETNLSRGTSDNRWWDRRVNRSGRWWTRRELETEQQARLVRTHGQDQFTHEYLNFAVEREQELVRFGFPLDAALQQNTTRTTAPDIEIQGDAELLIDRLRSQMNQALFDGPVAQPRRGGIVDSDYLCLPPREETDKLKEAIAALDAGGTAVFSRDAKDEYLYRMFQERYPGQVQVNSYMTPGTFVVMAKQPDPFEPYRHPLRMPTMAELNKDQERREAQWRNDWEVFRTFRNVRSASVRAKARQFYCAECGFRQPDTPIVEVTPHHSPDCRWTLKPERFNNVEECGIYSDDEMERQMANAMEIYLLRTLQSGNFSSFIPRRTHGRSWSVSPPFNLP